HAARRHPHSPATRPPAIRPPAIGPPAIHRRENGTSPSARDLRAKNPCTRRDGVLSTMPGGARRAGRDGRGGRDATGGESGCRESACTTRGSGRLSTDAGNHRSRRRRVDGAWAMLIDSDTRLHLPTDSATHLEHLVRSREDLTLNGWTDRSIAAAVRAKTMVHMRRGWYIDAEERRGLTPEEQHRTQVIAVARDSEGGAAMSHTSAGGPWRLPVYRIEFTRVHMTTGSPRRISSGPEGPRHGAPVPTGDR